MCGDTIERMLTEANHRRLLKTPPPMDDENLLGYLIRLAEANHYDSVSWVTNHAGLKFNFTRGRMILNRAGTDLSRLEELAGLRVGTLEPLKRQVMWWKPTFNFHGECLSAGLMKLSRPKVCPACLRESNYCRAT